MYSNVGAVSHSGFSVSKQKQHDGERENSKESALEPEHKEPISTRLLKFIKRRINPVVGPLCVTIYCLRGGCFLSLFYRFWDPAKMEKLIVT